MGYQPWYTGDTFPALTIPLNVEGSPDNITGLTTGSFAATMRRLDLQPNTDTPGTGTFTIVTANPAVITYQFSPGDVATAGTYSIFIKATFPNPGGGIAVYDPIPFTLTQS